MVRGLDRHGELAFAFLVEIQGGYGLRSQRGRSGRKGYEQALFVVRVQVDGGQDAVGQVAENACQGHIDRLLLRLAQTQGRGHLVGQHGRIGQDLHADAFQVFLVQGQRFLHLRRQGPGHFCQVQQQFPLALLVQVQSLDHVRGELRSTQGQGQIQVLVGVGAQLERRHHVVRQGGHGTFKRHLQRLFLPMVQVERLHDRLRDGIGPGQEVQHDFLLDLVLPCPEQQIADGTVTELPPVGQPLEVQFVVPRGPFAALDDPVEKFLALGPERRDVGLEVPGTAPPDDHHFLEQIRFCHLRFDIDYPIPCLGAPFGGPGHDRLGCASEPVPDCSDGVGDELLYLVGCRTGRVPDRLDGLPERHHDLPARCQDAHVECGLPLLRPAPDLLERLLHDAVGVGNLFRQALVGGQVLARGQECRLLGLNGTEQVLEFLIAQRHPHLLQDVRKVGAAGREIAERPVGDRHNRIRQLGSALAGFDKQLPQLRGRLTRFATVRFGHLCQGRGHILDLDAE